MPTDNAAPNTPADRNGVRLCRGDLVTDSKRHGIVTKIVDRTKILIWWHGTAVDRAAHPSEVEKTLG